jgi:hypothetical protein
MTRVVEVLESRENDLQIPPQSLLCWKLISSLLVYMYHACIGKSSKIFALKHAFSYNCYLSGHSHLCGTSKQLASRTFKWSLFYL